MFYILSNPTMQRARCEERCCAWQGEPGFCRPAKPAASWKLTVPIKLNFREFYIQNKSRICLE